ncbi:hypothetical protein PCE1_000974 [Barthelona sp. PCE]
MDIQKLRYSLEAKLNVLYPLSTDVYEKTLGIVDRYIENESTPTKKSAISAADNLLITYGDSLIDDSDENQKTPLAYLQQFLDERAPEITGVHLLPFCPYTSDDGFSVVDYRKINPELGSWDDVKNLAKERSLMFDLVLNHCSQKSEYFEQAKKEFFEGNLDNMVKFFHIFEKDPSELGIDYSGVTRPRPWPLFSKYDDENSEKSLYAWTTFSDDQVDLNFNEPQVFLEFLDVYLSYLANGATYVRLDAVGFLWKVFGTTCMHLNETHEVIRCLRIATLLAFGSKGDCRYVITETNVPHKENVSYFGLTEEIAVGGFEQEAQLVYNFTLPPLLLTTLATGNVSVLAKWANSLAESTDECARRFAEDGASTVSTMFNFTASHDGVGLRPLEGIVPQEAVDTLTDRMERLGSKFNMRTKPDGSKSVYEMNVTYFDACGLIDGENDAPSTVQHIKTLLGKECSTMLATKIQRFMLTQSFALSLIGLPGIYIHSLLGSSNWTEGIEEHGHNRAINRKKYTRTEIEAMFSNETSQHSIVFAYYKKMLRVRAGHSDLFCLDAPMIVDKENDSVICVRRVAENREIECIFNFSAETVIVERSNRIDAISNNSFNGELPPFGFVWLLE